MASNCVHADRIDCDASEFADAVYRRLPKNVYHDELTTAIDESLQEVREVLEGVIRVADRKTVEFGRARALLASLQIEKGGG